MCTYNGGRYLWEQLESIATQSVLPDELVICDDCSTDQTVEAIQAFIKHAPFSVRLEVNNRTYGSTKNFEKAVGLCKGEVVALADQDDVWNPEKLSRTATVLDSDERIGAVFSDATLIDENSRAIPETLWRSFNLDPCGQEKFFAGSGLEILLKHNVVTGATLAFRSIFRPLILPIPPNHIHDQWISVLLASVSHLIPIQTPLIKYRRHAAQQIGPGSRLSFRQTIAQSKQSGRNHYLAEAKEFQEICERICARSATFDAHPRALHLIQQKILHRTARGSFSDSRLLRLPQLVREISTLRYWLYSDGFGSLAKDILV
jgi:hypothetical protein